MNADKPKPKSEARSQKIEGQPSSISPFINLSIAHCSLLIAFLFLLSGCTSRPERIPGFLYLRLSSDITTLDPAMIVDVGERVEVAKVINCVGLLIKNLKDDPALAEGFSI